MTPERLAELRRLADDATPGPWEDYADPDDPPCRMGGAWAGVTYPAKTRRNGVFLDWEPGAGCSREHAMYQWQINQREVDAQSRADSAFIAAGRSALPELLDEVGRLTEEVESYRVSGEVLIQAAVEQQTKAEALGREANGCADPCPRPVRHGGHH